MKTAGRFGGKKKIIMIRPGVIQRISSKHGVLYVYVHFGLQTVIGCRIVDEPAAQKQREGRCI
jgi:hypothetical protein